MTSKSKPKKNSYCRIYKAIAAMGELYDPEAGRFLEETIMLLDPTSITQQPFPFLLPTQPPTTTTYGDDGNHLFLGDTSNASFEYPPSHFPDPSFAGFYSPPSCSELLLLQPGNFDLEDTLLMGDPAVRSPDVPAFDPRRKKGHPSKNLMAERRRRKRLNDRLSLLRSIVPKITKTDRTSILGDTIDYIKELLGRIHRLEQGNDEWTINNVFELSKEAKPNEVLVRNSPKFHVERRNVDTTIEIGCVGNPGLLLTTMSTLEALGLEVEHCVVSCFDDFAMRASCSEVVWDRKIPADSEDVIKQALFRSAGYGGKCL